MADGGRIVNVSSGLTSFALPGHSAYAEMKGAVEAPTRCGLKFRVGCLSEAANGLQTIGGERKSEIDPFQRTATKLAAVRQALNQACMKTQGQSFWRRRHVSPMANEGTIHQTALHPCCGACAATNANPTMKFAK